MFSRVLRSLRFANPSNSSSFFIDKTDWFKSFGMKTFLILLLILGKQISGQDFIVTKCCKDYEKFDSDLKKCIAYKERFKAPILFTPPMNEEVAFWVPPYLRNSRVYHSNSFIWDRFNKFTAVVSADNSTVERFLKMDRKPSSFVIDIFEDDLSNYLFRDQEYCFEGSDNPEKPHVIKTDLLPVAVEKCCKREEQFNRYLSRCLSHPGDGHKNINENKSIIEEIVGTNDTYWIPPVFMGKIFKVLYSIEGFVGYHTFKAFKLEDKGDTMEENRFAGMGIPLLSGDENDQSGRYCFDSVSDGPLAPRVLVYTPRFSPVISKCCLPGEILSDKGYCVIDATNTSNDSTLGFILDLKETIIGGIMIAPCMQNRYDTKIMEASDVDVFHLDDYDPPLTTKFTHYCVDWQNTVEGPRQVLGKCRLPANVKLYESVRPLGAVSAMILLAAIGAALIRKQTRTSAHGWALASHALCLATVNILQVTWFFTSSVEEDCSLYAYATYFFMLAGNAWLSTIAGNMLYGFRKPLRALQPRGGGGSDVAAICKRFSVMSCVAWGIPAALTALSVTRHLNYRWDDPNRLTFLETRLCLYEEIFRSFDDHQVYEIIYISQRKEPNFYGSLFHYYIPIAVLVVGNVACVLYVAYKIRTLNQDQSFLHRDHQQGSSNTQSALMYVKLLLLAGVLELSLEFAALSLRLRKNDEHTSRPEYKVELVRNTYYFTIAATFLDLGRAIAVLWLCTGWRCQAPGGESRVYRN